MSKNPPQIYFEISHLKYAEKALSELYGSRDYKEYRHRLENVETLEDRYSLARQYSEVLCTKYELENAILESKEEIEHIESAEE